MAAGKAGGCRALAQAKQLTSMLLAMAVVVVVVVMVVVVVVLVFRSTLLAAAVLWRRRRQRMGRTVTCEGFWVARHKQSVVARPSASAQLAARLLALVVAHATQAVWMAGRDTVGVNTT